MITNLKRCINAAASKLGNPDVVHGSILVRIDRKTFNIISFGKFIRQGGITYELYARIRDEKNNGKDWLPPALIPEDPMVIEQRRLDEEAKKQAELIAARNRQVEVERGYAKSVPPYLNEQLTSYPEFFNTVDREYVQSLIQRAESLIDSDDLDQFCKLRRDIETFRFNLQDLIDSQEMSKDEAVRSHNRSAPFNKLNSTKKGRYEVVSCE